MWTKEEEITQNKREKNYKQQIWFLLYTWFLLQKKNMNSP